jgi:S-DNA-T family DNA segregation ATPase FtsK/SpoIIIE
VFGDGAVAEGWLPHSLAPATDTDPKDAGHVYMQGIPGRPDEPIEYAVHETPSPVLRKLAEERLAAGLVEPDQRSLDAMATVDLPDMDDLPDVLSWPALLRLCNAKPPAGHAAAHPIVAEVLAVMEERGVNRMRTETLAAALHLTADELKTKMRAAGVADPTPIGEIDGLKNPRGYKRDMLAGA